MAADQTVRLIVDMGPSATNIGEAEQKLERLGQAATGASSKMAGFGQSALQAGRVVQDFTQGGIAGILNNIEGLSMALGGGAGLAGVMTIVGVAAFLLKDKIKALTDVFSEGKDKIPETTDRLERLTESLKKNKEATDELRKQESLNFFDMEKYRDLLADTAKKEEELANARAARAVGAYASKADQARAAAFKGAVGEFGGGVKLIEELMTTGGRTQQRAEEMIAEAMKGNRTEIQNILNRTQGFGQFYTSPEEQAQRKAQQDVQKRIQQDTEAKNRQLQQSAEAEARGPAEQERQKKEAERQREKAAREKAADEKAFASEIMGAAAPMETARQRRQRQAERQAGQLMAQGPEIIGQAFGPQAAMAAATAGPADVQAMRAETIRNLEAGQLPYDAVISAFEDVYRRSQQAAARSRTFGAQMMGMQGRFRQDGMSAMDK
jgi:hypothetical protein